MTLRDPEKSALYRQLHRIALRHCQRHLASRATLRRVLQNYLHKQQARNDGDDGDDDSNHAHSADEALTLVIDDLHAAGTIDDARYAEQQLDKLLQKGVPSQGLIAMLMAKQVDRDTAAALVQARVQGDEEYELQAAARYALRCGLGAARLFSAPDAVRDMQRLGRRGFSYDVAARVIAPTDIAQLQRWARYDR